MTAHVGLQGHQPGVTVRTAAATIEMQQEKIQRQREIIREYYRMTEQLRALASSISDRRAAEAIIDIVESAGRMRELRAGREP
jgi:hypothetical protein